MNKLLKSLKPINRYSVTLIASLLSVSMCHTIQAENSPQQWLLSDTNERASQSDTKPQRPVAVLQRQPKIQLAILLDTSGSMDGLIDQTRDQLWQVVNEFSSAKQNGQVPVLEVALFEYGNDGIPQGKNYVRKLSDLTRELDKVSEGLFQLTTNGGSEYCGAALATAVNSFQWSSSTSDLKTIFIAGNEPFTQGTVAYQEAIALAKHKCILVNTIFAGEYRQGIQSGWQSGAVLTGGDYMSIDADRQIAHIDAPQDQNIAQLNAKLSETFLSCGK